jgi:hypothetical protein
VIGDGAQYGVELVEREEPDVGIRVLGLRLLHEPARVLRDPALAERVVEDRMQAAEDVLDRLGRQSLLSQRSDQPLDVSRLNPVDRFVPEERRQMYPQVAVDAVGVRLLAAVRDQPGGQEVADMLDVRVLSAVTRPAVPSIFSRSFASACVL